MKKKISITFLILYTLASFAQKNNSSRDTTYIKLKFYKKIFKKKITVNDSAKIKIIDGDTLILVKNFKKFRRKASRIKDISFEHKTRSYMPLWQYKKRHKEAITKQDTINFKFKKNDTLILISNKDFYKNQKRISVPYEQKDSTFLETYKDVVYKKYNSLGNIRRGKKEFMRLWEKPLKIYFAPGLNNYYKKAIKKEVKKLSSIDSLKIYFVKNINKSNYIIYQINNISSVKYSKNIRENKYINYYINWSKGRIYDAKLEINLIQNGTIDKKENANILIQNFYQTLGRFFPTSKLPCNNIFSECYSSNKKLTEKDLEIIKYHYSYGICKFTDLKTFEENHKKAKEVIKNGGKMKFTHIY
ncbi:hypothetical protein [Polaribacter sp. SA4-10]|uniref:hypothetical protein n=1 Tax=Polaribacter sp. SA4-10 TaxID=754397 RepID=UPI0012FAD42B|nr:hypothetical protein [Polaribacter sp. SA4-10]